MSLLQMADPVVGLLTEDADGQFRRWGVNAQRQRSVSLVVLGEIYMSVRALSPFVTVYVLQNRHHLIMSLSLPFFSCSAGINYLNGVNIIYEIGIAAVNKMEEYFTWYLCR